MTIIEKLVYLIRQGTITIDHVAPEYKEEVKQALTQ